MSEQQVSEPGICRLPVAQPRNSRLDHHELALVEIIKSPIGEGFFVQIASRLEVASRRGGWLRSSSLFAYGDWARPWNKSAHMRKARKNKFFGPLEKLIADHVRILR
jgi:hypothetical protein